MDRFEWNKRNLFVLIIWITLIAIFIVSLFTGALVNEVADFKNAVVHKSPVQTMQEAARHIETEIALMEGNCDVQNG